MNLLTITAYYMVGGIPNPLPAGASFTDNGCDPVTGFTGTFTWTPTEAQGPDRDH